MDFRKLNAARVVVCPARDASAGVVSGSVEYMAYPTMSGQVPVERYGALPEFSEGVADTGQLMRALDSAVRSYVDWSARFLYLRMQANMFRETGFRFRPSHPYRVVVWVDSLDDGGYMFSFTPANGAGDISPDRVPDDAHNVSVSAASLEVAR